MSQTETQTKMASAFGQAQATLQAQDWFTPWVDYQPSASTMTRTDAEAILLTYARCFYFGD